MPPMQHHRSGWRSAAMALTLGVAGLSSPVQASLFGGDDEARRAILDLRQRLEQSQNATRALIEQNAQAQNQTQNQAIAQLRSALLDLQGQIDRLKAELAQSLGAQERLARDLTELQLRQKDVLSTVDDRLRRFEPVPANIDGREVMVDPAEKADHDKAMALFRQADFAAAQTALESFVLAWHQCLCALGAVLVGQCPVCEQGVQRVLGQLSETAEHRANAPPRSRGHARHLQRANRAQRHEVGTQDAGRPDQNLPRLRDGRHRP